MRPLWADMRPKRADLRFERADETRDSWSGAGKGRFEVLKGPK